MRIASLLNNCAMIAALVAASVVPLHAADQKPVVYTDAEPDALYRIVHDARWQVDAETVWACTSRRSRGSRDGLYETLMAERARLPESLTLRGRDVSERIAQLRYEGRRKDRDTGRIVVSNGLVTLVKEDGMWRIRDEQWHDVGFDLPAHPKKVDPASVE